MTNLEIMKAKLHENVIAPLEKQGFVGKWPHFRRIHENHIELITFQTNKYGGSFTVEMSAVFQNREDKNYLSLEGKAFSPDRVNVWDTRNRYRLKGMDGGWFYYRDLYRHRVLFGGCHYLDVSEKEAEGFQPPRGYKLVRKFNGETAERICSCVNRQMRTGFTWIKGFVKTELGREE